MKLDEYTKKKYGRFIFDFLDKENLKYANEIKALAQILKKAGYNEKNICSLLNISQIQAILPPQFNYEERYVLAKTNLEKLVQLFLFHKAFQKEELQDIFGENLLAFLLKSGVLLPKEGLLQSQVNLFCVGNLLFTTDARNVPLLWPKGFEFYDQVMYLGLDSIGLTRVIPKKRNSTALDLCCGCGVHGIFASRFCKDVIGVDINPRAIRFSRFNAQLNECKNIKFMSGNLYSPVKNRSFDLILANPPFAPQTKSETPLCYRDGGPDGEDILKEIIEDSFTHLNDEGMLVMVTLLFNLDHFKEKIQKWHKNVAGSANVLVLVECEMPLEGYAEGQSIQFKTKKDIKKNVRIMMDHFAKVDIQTIHLGFIIISKEKKTLNGSYHTLNISSPINRPIHRNVTIFFRSLKQIQKNKHHKYHVNFSPDLCCAMQILENERPSEQQTITILYSPDNPFFPEYEINDWTYQLIQAVQQENPVWENIATPENTQVLEDLVLKGILSLKNPLKPLSRN